MSGEQKVPAKILGYLLRYDPETGKLYWLHRPERFFPSPSHARRWNGMYAGTEAFTFSDDRGYKRGSIFGNAFKAHRVVWALCMGEWPSKEIDHKNGITHDNRIQNLREADRSENMRNQRKRSDNTSGLKGASWHSDTKKWAATIRVSGKQMHLGLFNSPEDAHNEYVKASEKYHGKFGRSS